MLIPVAVIGAGPAGTAAALQLKRSGIDFLLLEKSAVGGLLHEANLVENFPGIVRAVPGKTLAARMKRRLVMAGIAVEKGDVRHVSYHDGRFTIQTEKQDYLAAKVILACGTLPLAPGPPWQSLQAHGRLFLSVLPLLALSGKTIAVIGGGDAACDYALNLARKNTVHVLIRSANPCALPLLLDRCRRHPRITIHENFRPAGVMLRARAASIVLTRPATPAGREIEIACHLVLSAIGRAPALNFLDPGLHASLTALHGQNKLYVIGDAGNGRFRQAAIAAADGLRSAMEIYAGESR